MGEHTPGWWSVGPNRGRVPDREPIYRILGWPKGDRGGQAVIGYALNECDARLMASSLAMAEVLAEVGRYFSENDESYVGGVLRQKVRAVLAAAEWQDVTDGCAHEWVSAANAIVESGEVCLKCNSVRAAPPDGRGEGEEPQRASTTPPPKE